MQREGSRAVSRDEEGLAIFVEQEWGRGERRMEWS